MRKAYVERLSALEKGPSGVDSSQSVEELKKGVARYQAEVERQVKAAQNLGVYYKMLALKYLDADMYGLALDNLMKAIEIYPENPQLFYYSAVANARMAKASVTDSTAAADYLARAEAFYRRAIFLDPGNVNALYGLAVLYALEMSRPAEAEPLVQSHPPAGEEEHRRHGPARPDPLRCRPARGGRGAVPAHRRHDPGRQAQGPGAGEQEGDRRGAVWTQVSGCADLPWRTSSS